MGKISLLLILICLASKAFAGIVPTPVSIEDIAIEALMNNNSGIVPASAKANLFYEENGFPMIEDGGTKNEIFQKELMAKMQYFKKKYPHMKLYKYREKNGRWVLTDNLGASRLWSYFKERASTFCMVSAILILIVLCRCSKYRQIRKKQLLIHKCLQKN